MEYLLSHPQPNVNMNDFDKASGIGVVVTQEEIESEVKHEFCLKLHRFSNIFLLASSNCYN